MMKRNSYCAAVLGAGLLAFCCAPIFAGDKQNGNNNDNGQDEKPDGRGIGTVQHEAHPTGTSRTGNGISYHGGPVMTQGANVYYIWYGNWTVSDPTANTILTNLASYIGGSPYFNINTTYYNGSGTHVPNTVHYAGATSVSSNYKTSLSDADIQTIVSTALAGNALPTDSNGVYFVLTSQDINETSGFCTQYCGWHTHASLNGADIKYAFVGNAARCPSACAAQTTSPNGDAGADAMASVVAHELEESATDPDLNAWYDSRGNENADKCAWTFGTTKTALNGSQYNMTLGPLNYLIQRNWVNASGGYCALSY